MVFPKSMTEHGHKFADDVAVIVKARVDKREESPKLIAMEIDVFEGITDGAPPLRIKLAPTRLTEALIGRLKAILSEHPGESQVFLHLGDTQVLRLPDEFCVDATNGLVGELRVLLGPDALVS
jgi:DNA polymerase-3 subunit alpha